MCIVSRREDEENGMPTETMEIRAIWKERPGWFGPGMMQWVADANGPDGPYRDRESPAFPLENEFVTEVDPDGDNPFIHIHLAEMDDEKRKVVETMHAEFVASLERDGWVQTGQGREWHNLLFERAATP
jgi:hypothetical protein